MKHSNRSFDKSNPLPRTAARDHSAAVSYLTGLSAGSKLELPKLLLWSRVMSASDEHVTMVLLRSLEAAGLLLELRYA